MEELWQQNEENFTKTVLKYMEIKEEANNAIDMQYKRGQLALLQEAKRILENESQFKFIPFTDMVTRLEIFIDGKKSKEENKQKQLDLSGIKIKQKKKRIYKENPEDAAQFNNEILFHELQKPKKE